MATEHLLEYYGSKAGAGTFNGYTICPAVLLGLAVKDKTAEIRNRPTGESGSGPYFHAYRHPEGGVSMGYIHNNSIYVVQGGNTTESTDDRGSYADAFHHTEWVAAGWYCYVFSYTRALKPSSLLGWSEIVSAYLLSVLDIVPGFQNQNYPRVYGNTRGLSERRNWRDPIMGLEYYKSHWASIVGEANSDTRVSDLLLHTTTCYSNQSWFPGGSLYEAETPSFQFKYHEQDVFDWCMLTGGLSHHCESLATAAYIAACENLPGATCNSIANVIEIMGSLGGLFKGEPPRTPKNIKDVWLQYRYAITTTKLDIEEYSETTRRLMSLANASEITSMGQASDGKISCQCTITVDPSDCLPTDAKSWLKAYGFRLSALNAWDMVPYSFVVDWFLHIGDILERFQSYGDAISVPVKDMWYSFRTNYDGQDTFFRVPGKVYFTVPYVSYKQTSQKTVFKRILDAIALFT